MNIYFDLLFGLCVHVFLFSIALDAVDNDDLTKVFNTFDNVTNLLRILLWPIVFIFFFYKRRQNGTDR